MAKKTDPYEFIKKIASLKTEEEQDEDGDDYSDDEHVSSLNQIIEEAREVLGKLGYEKPKGKETKW